MTRSWAPAPSSRTTSMPTPSLPEIRRQSFGSVGRTCLSGRRPGAHRHTLVSTISMTMILQRSEPANTEIPLDSSSGGRRNVAEVTWSLVAGGAEMFAFTVAANLDREKYRTFFCALDQGGVLETEIDRAGIPYAVMNRRAGIDFRLMWRLYQFYRRNRIDVIHSHHFNQLFYSVLGAKLVGARIVHTEHSIEFYRHRRM